MSTTELDRAGRRGRGPLFALWLAISLALSPAVPASGTEQTVRDVTSVPLSFEVVNGNQSSLACQSNGDSYTVRGRLVAPAGSAQRPAVTLFAHEFSFGQFFWNFQDVPGYDLVSDLARDGHSSVVIDRVGYDTSGKPTGTEVCLGSQADMLRQIVEQLKAGDYAVETGAATPFEQVFLAGHSVGAAVAELAAHSFPDLDLAGLLVFAWANQGVSNRAIEQSLAQGQVCLTGGEPADEGGPPGYAYYGQTDEDFQGNVFHSADPVVVAAVTALRNRDPCGDASSLTPATAVNAARQGEIDVPVLLLFGEEDAIFEDGAAENEAANFSGSDDVTLEQFPDSGHALVFESAHADVRQRVSAWLTERSPMPAPPAPSADVDAAGPTPRTPASDNAGRLPSTGAVALAPLGLALLLLVGAQSTRRRRREDHATR